MAYNYKNDFPIFQHTDVAYIDNAATAQRPQCVRRGGGFLPLP